MATLLETNEPNADQTTTARKRDRELFRGLQAFWRFAASGDQSCARLVEGREEANKHSGQ